MQNNEHSESNRFRKFLQEKGYYIVLFLCILAVGNVSHKNASVILSSFN